MIKLKCIFGIDNSLYSPDIVFQPWSTISVLCQLKKLKTCTCSFTGANTCSHTWTSRFEWLYGYSLLSDIVFFGVTFLVFSILVTPLISKTFRSNSHGKFIQSFHFKKLNLKLTVSRNEDDSPSTTLKLKTKSNIWNQRIQILRLAPSLERGYTGQTGFLLEKKWTVE